MSKDKKQFLLKKQYMEKQNFKNLEDTQLYLLYKKIEQETLDTREAIIDTLSNFDHITKELERVENQQFNTILIKTYKEYLPHTPYDMFIEKRCLQEKLKEEIYGRIEKFKSNPKYQQIYDLCTKLAESEMTIDNFIHFLRIFSYVKKIKEEASSNKIRISISQN